MFTRNFFNVAVSNHFPARVYARLRSESAKQHAAERGITLSALLEIALRNLLLAQNAASAAPAFRLHTVRRRLVNPNPDLDHTSALVVTEDEASFRSERR